MNIPAEPILRFDNGRAIWLAAADGAVSATHLRLTPTGSEPVNVPDAYHKGALLLADHTGTTILGPVDHAQVLDYARLVIADDPRTRTRANVMLMLAAALLVLDHERNGR